MKDERATREECIQVAMAEVRLARDLMYSARVRLGNAMFALEEALTGEPSRIGNMGGIRPKA